MASTINASTTGLGSVIITPDSSGALALQTNSGTTAMTIDTSQNATFAGTVVMSSSFLRNRIINGDMRIDQRNAGASVATTNIAGEGYTLDRWYYRNLVASKYTIQQNAASVTPPTGFTNYLGCTSTSAYTVGTSEFFTVGQYIEGYNISDLAWGTASAKTVTLSFQVYSSLTGTFGGVVANNGFTRCYPFSYTISSANTWTSISITIAGDTSGTWLTTNGLGLAVRFSLGTGSGFSGTAGAWTSSTVVSATGAVSVVGTNGATWYVTGVQLEVGSTATPFERRLYGQELINCQRYYQQFGGYTSANWGNCQISGSGASSATLAFLVTMRTTPALTVVGTGYTAQDNSLGPVTATITPAVYTPFNVALSYTHAALTTNASRRLLFSDTTSFLQFSAEL
jgi:hypothetical protein